jgi:hypothetical protein
MAPKRIGISLFDDELKALVNATAKIFPISQGMVDDSLNPDNYEYGKIERSIYRWSGTAWEYIIADDVDIDWSDIQNKPTTYPPSSHEHPDLHTHSNKSLLDTITQILVDGWNTAVSHVLDSIRHITSDERTLWNTITGKADTIHTHGESDITNLDKYTQAQTDALLSGKAPLSHDHNSMYYTESEVDTLLSGKAPSTHDHDGRYYTESETNTLLGGKAPLSHAHTESQITDLDKYTQAQTDTLLSGKADLNHGHTDLHTHNNKSILDLVIASEPQTDYDLSQLQYIEDIRNGYTEGHTHSNKSVLDAITQLLIDGWNNAVSHISDAVKHVTSEERTLWNTVSGKADTVHTHPYALETHAHVKSDITDLSLGWADITGKPSTFPAEAHAHDDRYYTESEIDNKLATKADSTTLSGHTGNTTVHVTQTDKDNWNAKADIADIPPSITISSTKPTDGSIWYRITG